MSLELAVFLTARLLGFILLIQSVEMFWISQEGSLSRIWTFENLEGEIDQAFPGLKKFIRFLFSKRGFDWVVTVQMVLGVVALLSGQGWAFFGLFFTDLLTNIRFFGSFNGGSDSMVFVLLTGVLISSFVPSRELEKLGMIYITIHALLSYFKAGLVKITQPEWRNGKALASFLSQSLYVNESILFRWIKKDSLLAFFLAWSVLCFELGMPSILFFGSYSWIYLLIAGLFHLAIYFTLGLNRFFWAWICAWPAIFYTASFMKR